MTGLIARVPRARTTLILALSFLLLAFAANASAQRVQPHRTAQAHAHPHKKAVKKKPHRKHKAVKHRRPSAKHQTIKRHAAPAPHRRAKRTNAVRPRPAAAKPRLMASCGYSPRAVNTLHSRAAYVLDVDSGTPLLARNARTVRPIASISKLMTAVVARDADRPLNGVLRVTARDRDTIKFTGSRLQVGSELSRREMFHIALMSSENRAAAALSRDYPGGRAAFVNAMNREARRLGMRHTHFREPTGLSPHNVSTAEDLAKLVGAAAQDPLIRYFSTDTSTTVRPGDGELVYVNSDPLVRYRRLPIRLQKTGFINESGHGVVMRMRVKGRRETVVLLGAPTRAGVSSDAIKIHRWLSCSIQ
ncbi:serine hydrolase [Burkholderia cepacia]|uniref:Peptidase S11, D-alanyl-D-alanine carboxypeptidase 1 n=1 Tax=Burkholderia cepacia TaxID=292 RepID=A0AAE8T572_BURCE|nr:serine hydrolase [Burkholderia cepacia]KVE87658.1 D-alanyl-D-alanine endopeptidase [Burkholderia cepacia]KVW19490.1 D-alanyl-D-alanine endopeptidase [Burkholderia cepacia]MCA8025644.1 serine hydrolase [Burkholderia cepacia]POM18182.1 D-alanyl-D-alanine endopeptidase [Burkholderia cepacia]RRA23519.1 D-alanyl-D-alanine endopeptidase [Burkholderia cepacia]